MRITLLGVNGPYPAAGGACSGYLVEEGGDWLLIDCGAGVAGRMLERISLGELNAVVLSHLHFDHMSDLLVLRYAVDASARGALPVYLPEEPAPVRAMLQGGKLALYPQTDGAIAGFSVRFCPTVHPVMGCAIRLERGGKTLCFTGDTNHNEALVEFAQGCDLLLADAAFTDRKWKPAGPHMSARMCAELAVSAGAKQLVLTHLIPGSDTQVLLDEARSVFPDAILARQGMTITL